MTQPKEFEKNLVRAMGLEPTRQLTHAPQTCLSADSSTLAKTDAQLTSTTSNILPQAKNFVNSFLEKF